jgi:hypothetical protein
MKLPGSLWSAVKKLLLCTVLPMGRYWQVLAYLKGIRLTFPRGAIFFKKGTREIVLPAKNFAYIGEVIRSFSFYFDSIVPVNTPRGELVDLSTPKKLTLRDEGVAFWMNSLTEPAAANRL